MQMDQVTACLAAYHATGMKFQQASASLVSAFQQAAPQFNVDVAAASPLARFAEVLDTVQQHHSIMLQQTELLLLGEA
jgi:hypothetical protein